MAGVAEDEAGAVIWPRLVRCAGCGGRVLLARHVGAGRPFRLEPVEVFPEGPCGRCRGTGRAQAQVWAGTSGGQRGGGRRLSVEPGDLVGRTSVAAGPCPTCGGTGRRGEPVPSQVVAVGPDGVARRLDGVARGLGEALHVPHRCGAAVRHELAA